MLTNLSTSTTKMQMLLYKTGELISDRRTECNTHREQPVVWKRGLTVHHSGSDMFSSNPYTVPDTGDMERIYYMVRYGFNKLNPNKRLRGWRFL